MRVRLVPLFALSLSVLFVMGSCSWLHAPLITTSSQATEDTLPFEDSPFGFHPAGVERAGYPDNGFIDAQYIGVRWHRPPVYAYWFLIQPDLSDPTYEWTLHDRGSVYPWEKRG
jgi:hypothetical protein